MTSSPPGQDQELDALKGDSALVVLLPDVDE